MLRAVFALVAASTSFAAAQNIRFEVQPDGEVLIKSADGAAAVWDGYTLSCEAGCLNPDAWRSVQDHFPPGVDPMVPIIGVGAFGFGEAGTPNEYSLSEINLAGEAVLPAADEILQPECAFLARFRRSGSRRLPASQRPRFVKD